MYHTDGKRGKCYLLGSLPGLAILRAKRNNMKKTAKEKGTSFVFPSAPIAPLTF